MILAGIQAVTSQRDPVGGWGGERCMDARKCLRGKVQFGCQLDGEVEGSEQVNGDLGFQVWGCWWVH